MALPPPPGLYVPIVLFFDENEDLDVPAIKAHVLRLAEVCLLFQWIPLLSPISQGQCHRHRRARE